AGTIDVPAGAPFRFLHETNNLNPGARLTGPGQFLIEGDTFGGPHVVLNGNVTAPADLRLANGVVDGAGTLTIPTGVTFNVIATNSTVMSGSGTTVIQSGATMVLGGASGKEIRDRTTNNSGTIRTIDGGSLAIDGNAVLNNLAQGTFRIENDVDFGTNFTA